MRSMHLHKNSTKHTILCRSTQFLNKHTSNTLSSVPSFYSGRLNFPNQKHAELCSALNDWRTRNSWFKAENPYKPLPGSSISGQWWQNVKSRNKFSSACLILVLRMWSPAHESADRLGAWTRSATGSAAPLGISVRAPNYGKQSFALRKEEGFKP